MIYCIQCGEKVADGVQYCSVCGAKIPEARAAEGEGQQSDGQQAGGQQYSYTYGQQDSRQTYQQAGTQNNQQTYQAQPNEYFNPEDVRRNKAMGVLSYLGILVLIPLLARDKNSEYTKFHLNQGLVLFIANVIINLISGGSFFGLHALFSFHWWYMEEIGNLLGFVIFIFAVVGIVYACKGLKKELPLVNKIKLIK